MSGYANCIFAMLEDEIEDVSSDSTNSITSEEDDEYLETFETEDDVDPLMYCSPRYASPICHLQVCKLAPKEEVASISRKTLLAAHQTRQMLGYYNWRAFFLC